MVLRLNMVNMVVGVFLRFWRMRLFFFASLLRQNEKKIKKKNQNSNECFVRLQKFRISFLSSGYRLLLPLCCCCCGGGGGGGDWCSLFYDVTVFSALLNVIILAMRHGFWNALSFRFGSTLARVLFHSELT